jgi:hypothetical protein
MQLTEMRETRQKNKNRKMNHKHNHNQQLLLNWPYNQTIFDCQFNFAQEERRGGTMNSDFPITTAQYHTATEGIVK